MVPHQMQYVTKLQPPSQRNLAPKLKIQSWLHKAAYPMQFVSHACRG